MSREAALGEQSRTSTLERLLEEELALDDQPHALGAERLRKDRADAVLARRRGELEALVGRQCVRQLGFPAEDAVALELQLALVVFVLRADLCKEGAGWESSRGCRP